MKRTTRLIGGSGPLEGHEITYNVLDLRKIQDSVDRFLWYHLLLFVYLLYLLLIRSFRLDHLAHPE